MNVKSDNLQYQSHYIEVGQGDIFMEQKMGFGLILGQLAILKKKGTDYEQLLRAVFSCFQGQKNYLKFLKNIVAFALKSCIK